MNFSKEYIAQIIKKARKEKGLKQSELAESVGITEKHLSKIETGRNYPALDNFLRIIDVLNLSLRDFGLKEENNATETKSKLLPILLFLDLKCFPRKNIAIQRGQNITKANNPCTRWVAAKSGTEPL